MTLKNGHWQLNGPDRHPGDQLDCVPCRSALLETFKGPVDVSRIPVPEDIRPYVLPGPCLYCAHPHHSELVCRPDCTCTFGYPVHWRTFGPEEHRAAYAWEHESRPSFWTVCCSCGYRTSGHSAQPVSSEALAEAWAIKHVMEMDGQ